MLELQSAMQHELGIIKLIKNLAVWKFCAEFTLTIATFLSVASWIPKAKTEHASLVAEV